MRDATGHALMVVAVLGMSVGSVTAQPRCAPSRPDTLGPFYTENAPARAMTGRGLVITGRVLAVERCAALAPARLQWWSAHPNGSYDRVQPDTRSADKL